MCCHVATVKSSRRRSGLRILQIIMSVTQQLVPVILGILSEFGRVAQVASLDEGKGCDDVSVKYLTAAYNW